MLFRGLTADARVERTGASAKQGSREDGADVWGSYFHSSTAFGCCPEREKILLVTMAALCSLIIARGSDGRCGWFISLKLRGRRVGIVALSPRAPPSTEAMGHLAWGGSAILSITNRTICLNKREQKLQQVAGVPSLSHLTGLYNTT
jgi:hypothetical protein